jgi:hypothetical protein
MALPFTRDEFLGVFAAYNTALWPFVVALWIASAVLLIATLVSPRAPRRAIRGLLALLWAWSAVAYHAACFTRINPAAWLFAAMFLIQAEIFLWTDEDLVLRIRVRRSLRDAIGIALIVYALAYPALAFAEDLHYPDMPLFAVPCPTTILTIGFLMLADPPPHGVVSMIPIVWAVIGGSAAFLLGMWLDVGLIAAGAAMVFVPARESSGAKNFRRCEKVPPARG